MPGYDPEKHREDLQRQAISAAEAITCPNDGCTDDLRYPIDWEQALGTLWRITLRCPNCEEVFPGIIDEEEIEKLDIVLDKGTDRVVKKLGIVTRNNMKSEKIVFVRALKDDHILPEDF